MKRTGVIVGTRHDVTWDQADEIVLHLQLCFPGVQFAVVSGSESITFTYDDAGADGPQP